MFKKFREKIARHRDYIGFLKKKGCKIGERCEIYLSADFGSEPYLITLGNHVRVNSDVRFVTHDGGVWVVREKGFNSGVEFKDDRQKIDLFGKIIVGNNVHIGTGAIIMPGVNIGNNCIIGCGAIVTKSVPDNSVAVGVPARVIETTEEYIKKHIGDFDYTKYLNSDEKKEYLLKKFEKKEN